MAASDHTRPTDETRQAESRAAGVSHDADRAPTRDEEQEAEGHRPDPSVSEHAREMAERGAHQKGEGRI